jgi:hypothetical protein
MDCAGFERELVEVMDGGAASSAEDRDLRLRALRVHAAMCEACAGCEELLQLLERSAAAGDPGQAYWDSFEGRVRERIRRESRSSRLAGRRWIAAVAAAILLAVVGTWTIRRMAPESNPTTIAGSETGPTESVVALPEELERMVQTAPADALVQLQDLAGWGAGWEDPVSDEGAEATGTWSAAGGVFPDVSDLDGDASRALLLWLRQQTS